MKKSKVKNNLIFIIITTILVIAIFYIFSLNVYSQTKENAMRASKEQVDTLECEYIKVAQSIMSEYGCKYSGVTMTKIYGEDGIRDYELVIHHQNLKYLDDEEINQLKKDLHSVLCDDNYASFSFVFNS